MPHTVEQATAEIVAQYVRVWNEPNAGARRAAVAAMWVVDGVEFVEGAAFRGHDQLSARIAGAYQEFVASDRYAVTAAADVSRHDDIVVFTLQLTTAAGGVDWAARVFLLLAPDGRIQADYQLTVKPLPLAA